MSQNAAALANMNPFIFGNDVDSVDVATRVAFVSVLRWYSRLASVSGTCF